MAIDFGLAGKRAVVAGAGYIPERAGHGRAITLRLAEAGAAVACVDVDEQRAVQTVSQVRAAGGQAFAVVADMTVRSEVAAAIAAVVDELGGVDICVDIIGGALWERAEAVSLENWDWSLTNNLTQVFHLFQEVGQRMIAQGTGGSLLAISSVDGTVAAKYHAAYGAAKAGVISMAKSLAQEWGQHGIRVNTVAPGAVGSGNEEQPENEWGRGPVHPLAAPRTRDIANAALFLSSGLAARITGQTLVVDGGASVRELWGITPDVLAGHEPPPRRDPNE